MIQFYIYLLYSVSILTLSLANCLTKKKSYDRVEAGRSKEKEKTQAKPGVKSTVSNKKKANTLKRAAKTKSETKPNAETPTKKPGEKKENPKAKKTGEKIDRKKSGEKIASPGLDKAQNEQIRQIIAREAEAARLMKEKEKLREVERLKNEAMLVNNVAAQKLEGSGNNDAISQVIKPQVEPLKDKPPEDKVVPESRSPIRAAAPVQSTDCLIPFEMKEGDWTPPPPGSDCFIKCNVNQILWDESMTVTSLHITNEGPKKRAFKMRCSDNTSYCINPILGFLDPTQSTFVAVMRTKPIQKTDLIEVESIETEETAPTCTLEVFKNSLPRQFVRIISKSK